MPESGIDYPWLRRIRVEVTGLGNSVAPLFGDPAIRNAVNRKVFESDGTPNNLRISAKIQKTVQSAAVASSVWIWNLSPDTRNNFQRSETEVTVYAGWDHGPYAGLHRVFYGQFLTAQHQRQGPDVVTQLFLQSGHGAANSTSVYKTWRNEPVRNIVLDIARRMKGVAVDEKLVSGIVGHVGERGWCAAGSASHALTRLAQQYGFHWSIQDGVFQTVSKNPDGTGGAIGKDIKLGAPYLVNASSMLSGIRQYRRGVYVTSAFNPALRPGNSVIVESSVDPGCNGSWRVQKLEHSLDCYAANSFTTAITAMGRRSG